MKNIDASITFAAGMAALSYLRTHADPLAAVSVFAATIIITLAMIGQRKQQ